jgi:hypothetical protein
MAAQRHTVKLTDENLAEARRALLDAIYEQGTYFVSQVDELRQGVWPPGVVTEDAEASTRELRKLLEALDALGWPPRARGAST